MQPFHHFNVWVSTVYHKFVITKTYYTIIINQKREINRFYIVYKYQILYK